MDSLRTTHARLAALLRYRDESDPDVIAARADLERCREQTNRARARISHTPSTLWAQLLEGTTADV